MSLHAKNGIVPIIPYHTSEYSPGHVTCYTLCYDYTSRMYCTGCSILRRSLGREESFGEEACVEVKHPVHTYLEYTPCVLGTSTHVYVFLTYILSNLARLVSD